MLSLALSTRGWSDNCFFITASGALEFQVGLGDKAEVARAGIHETEDPSVDLSAATEDLT